MAIRQARQLRVAAVQLDCQAGQVPYNLDHASRFIEEAAFRVPWYAFIWPLTQQKGERAYQQSVQRKQRAAVMSRGTTPPPA